MRRRLRISHLSASFRRWARSRQAAQELVEFGLLIIGVAIVGMVGLKVMGHAEQQYFVPLQDDLAPTAPVGTDDVVHATSVTVSCDHVSILVGKTTTCTLTATDIAGAKRTAPAGTVSLIVDDGATAGPCTLGPVAGTGNPPVTSNCIIAWTTVAGDVGTRQVSAVYTPTDGNHSPPPTAPVVTIVVQPVLNFGYGCTNPYFTEVAPWNVEPGHPLICGVTVYDSTGVSLYNHPLDVTWTPQTKTGDTYLYCATGQTCGPVGATLPVKDGPITCHTDPSTGGSCRVVFRRSFNDLTQISVGGEYLTVGALPTWDPTQNIVQVPIGIEQPLDEHPVQSIVDCSSSGPTINQSPRSIRAYPSSLDGGHVNKLGLITAGSISAPAGATLTCVLAIMDLDPNPTLNQYGCPWGTSSYCVGDNGDGHPPLGNVTFVDQNDAAIPVVSSPTNTCSANGLGHQGGRPTGIFSVSGTPSSFGFPNPAPGQPEYASWCTVVLKLPSDPAQLTQITATYDGESGTFGKCKVPHQRLYLGTMGSCASQTSPNSITVTLH